MIRNGQLEPGERLLEDRLAEQLGVSRNPVREAIRALENTGLVEVRPRRGAYVATLDPERAVELLELRSVLEAFAAQLAAQRRTPEQLAEIRHWFEVGPRRHRRRRHRPRRPRPPAVPPGDRAGGRQQLPRPGRRAAACADRVGVLAARRPPRADRLGGARRHPHGDRGRRRRGRPAGDSPAHELGAQRPARQRRTGRRSPRDCPLSSRRRRRWRDRRPLGGVGAGRQPRRRRRSKRSWTSARTPPGVRRRRCRRRRACVRSARWRGPAVRSSRTRRRASPSMPLTKRRRACLWVGRDGDEPALDDDRCRRGERRRPDAPGASIRRRSVALVPAMRPDGHRRRRSLGARRPQARRRRPASPASPRRPRSRRATIRRDCAAMSLVDTGDRWVLTCVDRDDGDDDARRRRRRQRRRRVGRRRRRTCWSRPRSGCARCAARRASCRLPTDVASWPLVMDVAGRFYFEPETGGLLLSPADEHTERAGRRRRRDGGRRLGAGDARRGDDARRAPRPQRPGPACARSPPIGCRWSVGTRTRRASAGWSVKVVPGSRRRRRSPPPSPRSSEARRGPSELAALGVAAGDLAPRALQMSAPTTKAVAVSADRRARRRGSNPGRGTAPADG